MSVFLATYYRGNTPWTIRQDEEGVAAVEGELPPESVKIWENRNAAIGNGPVQGEGVFDFRYGPFTGGYPEAGVLHYFTYGEKILSVRVDLSCKHRGIERTLSGLSVQEASRFAAGLCGNFTVAHSLAFCRAIENAAGVEPGRNDLVLRLVALELERVYNHLYVIWRLASAAAQKVLASLLGDLFERALRLTKVFSGKRGMANFVVPGGTEAGTFEKQNEVARQVERLSKDFRRLYRLSLSSRNYLDRLHKTATLSEETALKIGLTGPSLRATGLGWDLRVNEPILAGFYPRIEKEGDAFARMEVRAQEILHSCELISKLLQDFSPGASSRVEVERTGEGLGYAESPTGTVVWKIATEKGKVASALVSTPSVFGFQAYAEAVTGNIFTDVPFAVESFGLSFADAGR